MAIKAAAGYPQYSGSLIQPVHSDIILEQFRCRSLFQEITTTDYLGELRGRGDRITFYKEPKVSIRKHVKNGVIKHDNFEAEMCELTIDCALEFSVKIARLDEKMINTPNWARWQSMIMAKAAEKMQRQIDRDVMSAMYCGVDPCNQGKTAGVGGIQFDFGAPGDPLLLNKDNCLDLFVNISCMMDEHCIPMQDRWIVIPPAMKACMMLGDLRRADMMGLTQSPLLNGALPTMFNGLKVYVSPYVPRVWDVGANCAAFHILAGWKGATAFASCLEDTRIVDGDQDRWDKYLQGLTAYGFGIIRPEALFDVYVKFQ